MFADQLEAALGDRRVLARMAEDTEIEQREVGCRKLRLAAAWADAHAGVDDPEGGIAVEQLVAFGPADCPLVAETSVGSLATAFRTSTRSARGWMGDALNLRHRLPRLWSRIVAGEVYAWKAREIARATAHLNAFAVRQVDKLLFDQVEIVAWTRFLGTLDATLLQVDPKTYGERQAKAAAQRDVRATQSGDGLRTVIARGTSGDIACFLAAVDAVAEALADEGDEDSYPVRKSKAIGILAYPRRADEFLTRGRHRPDPRREPWQQVDDFQHHPDDPWADQLPPAGWETDRHANYSQPSLDEGWGFGSEPAHDNDVWPLDEPITNEDLEWYLGRAYSDPVGVRVPVDQEAALDHESGTTWIRQGGGLDLSPRAFGDLTAHRPTVHIYLHLTEQTLREGRGVVRTDHGPITVEQLRHFVGDACPNIKVYPVFDPAEVAAVDSYEIPVAQRKAHLIKHPGSVFPLSPVTKHLDVDHSDPYRSGGPPGQTSVDRTGPLSRTEHRAKTVGGWRVRQPSAGLFVWRSPEGQVSVCTNQGTLILGDTTYTQHLWRAAVRNTATATA